MKHRCLVHPHFRYLAECVFVRCGDRVQHSSFCDFSFLVISWTGGKYPPTPVTSLILKGVSVWFHMWCRDPSHDSRPRCRPLLQHRHMSCEIPERVYYYNFHLLLGELPHNSSLIILVWSIASSSLLFSTAIVSFLRDGTNKWKIREKKYRKKEFKKKRKERILLLDLLCCD